MPTRPISSDGQRAITGKAAPTGLMFSTLNMGAGSPAIGPHTHRENQIQPPACNTKIPIFVVTAAIKVVITIIAAASS